MYVAECVAVFEIVIEVLYDKVVKIMSCKVQNMIS